MGQKGEEKEREKAYLRDHHTGGINTGRIPPINIPSLTQPCSSIEVGVGLLNDVTTTGSPKAVLARKLSVGLLRLNLTHYNRNKASTFFCLY